MQTRFPKWKLLTFALLSICDFVITYLLLSRNHEAVYEANPIANKWLQQSGWLGLAAFKMTFVFTVMLIATYVYYRRPRMAHDLLAVCCGVVVVAVITGTSIAMTVASTEPAEETSPIVHRSFPTKSAPVRTVEYREMLDHLANDLSANRMELDRAVDRLQKAELARKPDWIAALRRAYPGLEDRALIAADIIQHTVSIHLRTSLAKPLAERLERQFQNLYGVTPELPYRQMLHLTPLSAKSSAQS